MTYTTNHHTLHSAKQEVSVRNGSGARLALTGIQGEVGEVGMETEQMCASVHELNAVVRCSVFVDTLSFTFGADLETSY